MLAATNIGEIHAIRQIRTNIIARQNLLIYSILMDSFLWVGTVLLWMIILCICTGEATCVTDLLNIQW